MKVICEVNKKEKEGKAAYFHMGKPLIEITEEEYQKVLKGREKNESL